MGALGLRNFNIWFRLRGVDQVCELNGVLNEEDWNVVAHDIPIALLSVEFDGETSHVSHCIGAASRPEDGRKSKEDRCGSRSVGQNPSTGHVFGAFVELEDSECTGTASMSYLFGNTLVVEMVYL